MVRRSSAGGHFAPSGQALIGGYQTDRPDSLPDGYACAFSHAVLSTHAHSTLAQRMAFCWRIEHKGKEPMKLFTRMLTTGVVTAATALTGTAAAVADTPPPVVEDFAYPHADKIFEERGIKLKRGDGHILLDKCDSRPGLIEVYARGMQERDKVGQGKFCFRVTGKTGYLSLELPKVYGAKGNDYAVKVNMATDNQEKSFDLDKNKWTAVGETADPQGREFSLLEIVAKK